MEAEPRTIPYSIRAFSTGDVIKRIGKSNAREKVIVVVIRITILVILKGGISV